MNIDITPLKNGTTNQIEINEEYSFSKEELSSSSIISLDNVKIKGIISNSYDNEYNLQITIKGVMVLPCSITLNPVDYPFEVQIEGNINNLLEEIGESLKKIQNTIDILPIIWENIVMEIPIRVVSKEAKSVDLKGEGWELITESKEKLNPELQKLNNLLNEK